MLTTKRTVLTGIFTAVVMAATTAQTAVTETRPVSTIYDLYLGGIKAGELTIDAEFQPESYSARSIMRTAGIVGMLYNASFEAVTEGALTKDGLAPNTFSAASRMSSKEQYVEMVYDGDAPREVRAEPAFIPKPWQIEPSEQTGTLDPISAALFALAPTTPDAMCNTSVEVFDGRRRYAIDLGKPVQDGKRIKCKAMYRRIAGFKPKMMRKRPTFPFNIWYEMRPDGLAHIVRGAGESMFGLAVILLRK